MTLDSCCSGAAPLLDWSKLKCFGWTTVSGGSGTPLHEIAKSIGEPVPPRPDRPITRELKTLRKCEAENGSLSSILGRAEFPLHTDCAYYRQPPSYILFRAMRPSSVSTIFVDGDSVLKVCDSRILTALFRVRGLRKHFLCKMVSGNALRWDTNCMFPADLWAKEAAAEFATRSAEANPIRFQWEDTTTILILDNRRMLHGRESAVRDPRRHLESVLVQAG